MACMTKIEAKKIIENLQSSGDFGQALYKTISKADMTNLNRLHKGFEKEVNAYCIYMWQQDWADCYSDWYKESHLA